MDWMMCFANPLNGLDDVFPPDDLGSRPEALWEYIYIYIYIYIYNGCVIQYWRSCTPSRSIGLYFWGVRGSWAECHFFFLWFTNCVLFFDKSLILGCLWPLVFVLNNTLILIWYLVFYNPSPPRMFLSLDLLSEYRIQHGANGPLYVTSSYSTWIFCRGVSGFATDCPCGVWCRGLTILRPSYLHNGISYTGKITSLYWIRAQVSFYCLAAPSELFQTHQMTPSW